MNLYEVLGVPESASPDDIKRAYRKLASQHHPDRGGDTKKFQEIQSAYDTLSDPNKKQQYDLQRQGVGPGGINFSFHTNMPDLDAIFRNFGFGNDPFGNFRHQQPRRNKDLKVDIVVSLESTLAEQKSTISVQTSNGSRQTVDVQIPRGVNNGTNIRYPELGDNLFNTLPRGDLYINIIVQPNPNFYQAGIDLFQKISVNCLQAVVGGSIIVTGLDNKQFELKVPPGTQHGTRFRIPGQGLYELNSSTRGNLYAEIDLRVPQNLTQAQLDLIHNFLNNQ